MSKLIIVCGLPGSGKTTFATALSQKTGIVCLHKDAIKEQLFDSFGMSTLEDNKRIGKPSVDVMLHLAAQQIENGVDVMIEAPFNFPEDYAIFTAWAARYNVQLYSVICHVDVAERKRRCETRPRHAAHCDAARMRDFFPQTEYDYAAVPGKHIRINTDQSVADLVERVVAEIRA